MTAVAIYHTSGTAKAGKQRAVRINSAAIGHPLWGQTSPMLYLDAMMRCHCYQSIFKKIRRKYAVFPARRYTGNGSANKESQRQEPKKPS